VVEVGGPPAGSLAGWPAGTWEAVERKGSALEKQVYCLINGNAFGLEKNTNMVEIKIPYSKNWQKKF